MAATTSYTPGPYTAVAAPDAWLLVETDPAAAWLATIWKSMGRLEGIDTVLRIIDELGETGPRNFVCLAAGGSSVELVVSGSARAVTEGGETLNCPPSARRASFELAAGLAQIQLTVGDPAAVSASTLPVSAGVVSAAALTVSWVAAETESRAEPAPASSPAEPEPVLPDAAEPATEPEVATVVAEPEPAPAPAHLEATAIFDSPAERTILPSDLEEPAPAKVEALAGDSGYDYLFGATINRSVEEAAVRAAEPVEAHEEPEAPPTLVTAAADPPPVTSAPPPLAPTAGMIDNVPWATTPDDSPPPPLASAAPVSDDDAIGMTMVRGAENAMLRHLSAPGSLQAHGPAVRAVRCPAGHLNPPHVDRCRVCAGAVAEQAPVTVPRPVLGLLKLSTGGEITVDRAVLIGRSPSTDRLIDGQRPHILKLPSPDQDISRNHVEVRIDGWHVLVSDLDSTNGTVVLKPGGTPERLRPNDPMMIEPGTIVTIADEVSFTYMAV